jgi:hypothetical protein
MAVINQLPHPKGGGGSETETVLWENSSPTSAFAAKTVTLSDSLENYDKLRIYAIRTTATSDHVVSFDVNIAGELDYFVSGENKMAFSISMLGEKYNYSRIGYITTFKNGVYFTTAYRVNSTSGHNTSYCVPVKISGIK